MRREQLKPHDAIRRPQRGALLHTDLRGLDGLMHEYLAFGDELEEIPSLASAAPLTKRAKRRPYAA